MSFATVDPLAALSALVYLAIAIVAARRAAEAPLARPLCFFTLGLFTYVIFEQGTQDPGHTVADAIENAIASLIFVPGVELLFAFTGRRREFRWVRVASLGFYAPLAIYCFLPVYEQRLWEIGMLVGLVFFFGVPGWVLVQHYRRSGLVERSRTVLLLGSLLLGGVGAASTLLTGYGAPRLLEVGSVASGLLLAALSLDDKLLRSSTRLSALTAVVFASFVVIGELVLFSLRERTEALFVAGTVALVLIAFAALRPVITSAATQRARVQHLATLGALAGQMSHDLRNPLAAIFGNVEYLLEERRQGRSIDGLEARLEGTLAAAQRLARLVADYRRLSSVVPATAHVRLGAVIEDTVTRQRAPASELRLESAVPGALRDLVMDVDDDLLKTALESLIRNACDAITESGHGGAIRVALSTLADRVAITVEDDGPGMDPRTVEQAREHYFTTRATGTGLGLSYAVRVAEAHGGELTIDSEEGAGTVVRILLPAHRAISGLRRTGASSASSRSWFVSRRTAAAETRGDHG
jgi:signal transduction histidine kinase